MTKITQKGQFTIPAKIRKFLGLKTSDEVEFQIIGQQVVIKRKKAESPFKKYRGALKSRDSRSTDEIMDELRGTPD
jgi:AbrB family looped-hinge helix DNA binding protein